MAQQAIGQQNSGVDIRSLSSERDSDTDPSRIAFGIKIKTPFNIWQLVTIPLVALCTTTVGVYMNAQLAYMLEDKNMFDIPSS